MIVSEWPAGGLWWISPPFYNTDVGEGEKNFKKAYKEYIESIKRYHTRPTLGKQRALQKNGQGKKQSFQGSLIKICMMKIANKIKRKGSLYAKDRTQTIRC